MCSFTVLQRWARAFRDDEYHAAVNTNNGAQVLNKVLKYSFLPRQAKAKSLSGQSWLKFFYLTDLRSTCF